MSKRTDRFRILLSASLAVVVLACSTVRTVLFGAPTLEMPTVSAPAAAPAVPGQPMPGLEGYWQEGPKVFTIAWQNGQYVVTAFNEAGTSDPQILSQSWNGTSLSWTYKKISSASKSYTIATQSLNGDRLTAQKTDDQGGAGPTFLRRVSAAIPVDETLPYQDDFSDPGSGWHVYESKYGSAKYANGYYLVRSRVKEWYMSGGFNGLIGDAVITVDATSVGGPSSNNYGFEVECHMQPKEDYYRFAVDAAGYYTVGIYRQGESGQYSYNPLWSGDRNRASGAIHTGTATNHVVVTCARGNLKLEVNGKTLFQDSDSTFGEGELGLGVISFEDVPAEYHFDNLAVTAP